VKSPSIPRKSVSSPAAASDKSLPLDGTGTPTNTGPQPGTAGFSAGIPQNPSNQPNPQFDEAISLIKKIKTRYADQPNNTVFKEFLEILNYYRNIQPDGDKKHTQEVTVSNF
jgi:histone deacetylase complex regulatory component SIN3